jgi:hypothetical protein
MPQTCGSNVIQRTTQPQPQSELAFAPKGDSEAAPALSAVQHIVNHPDWLFEATHDGFRALACAGAGHARLVSRAGHAC